MRMTFVHSEEKRAKDPAYYHATIEKRRESRKKTYEKNRDINLKRMGDYRRKRYTGFSPEDYDKLLEEQGGRCFICDQIPDSALHADHCHSTKTKRKLLCRSCNTGLGLFRDRPELLEKAAEYLRAHGG